jgi:WD40 repeat protein
LSGGGEGKIRAWAVVNNHPEFEIDLGWGHHVRGLAWHPACTTFIAAIAPDGAAPEGSQSRVVVFDAPSGRELMSLFPDGHQLYCCAFSPDGRLIAAAGGGTDRGGRESKTNCVIHVWDARSGQAVASLAGHSGLVRDLAFSPDSSWLISAGWDNTVRSWQLDGVS